MGDVERELTIDGHPSGPDELEALLRSDGEKLLVLSVPGCSPCAAMKDLLGAAADLLPAPPARHDVVFAGGAHRDEAVSALLGKPLTMFPTVLFRPAGGDRHWLRGMGDKAGAWTAERLADWIRRCRN